MFKPAMKQVRSLRQAHTALKDQARPHCSRCWRFTSQKPIIRTRPVAWWASEKRIDFVLPFFEAEQVPLLESRSRSFPDLRGASRDALAEGACAVVVDSITHYWKELYSTDMQKNGRRMEKVPRVKEEWEPFAQDFQDSPVHFLVSDRIGYRWEEYEVEDPNGNLQKEFDERGNQNQGRRGVRSRAGP